MCMYITICILKTVISDSRTIIIQKQRKLKCCDLKCREINSFICAYLLLLLLLLLFNRQKKKMYGNIEQPLINTPSPNFLRGENCQRKYLYYCSGTVQTVSNHF